MIRRRLGAHLVAVTCCGFAITGITCDTPDTGTGDDPMDVDGTQDGNVDEENVACCLPDGCQVMDLIACVEANGGVVDGEASCVGDPCNRGACCSNGGCIISTFEECDTNYQGDGTTCNTGFCLLGACCFEQNFGPGFCMDENREDCDAFTGTWLGIDTKCEPTKPCGGEPDQGACCLMDGGCELADETTCVLSGRHYAGDGVDCTSDLCATGACCRENDCLDTARFGCVDDFKGNGTRCNTVDCTVDFGACCFGSGECVEIEGDVCGPVVDGTFLGDGTTCLPNDPCDEPLGACCVDGICQELRETSCASTQGEYHGDNTNCTDDPDICDQVFFQISSVDYQNTVRANTEGLTMTVTWDGVLNFPVQVRYRLADGAQCPVSICSPFIVAFAEEANPLSLTNTPSCNNAGDTSDLPALFPYEVVIADSIDRESAPFPAPWTCDFPP